VIPPSRRLQSGDPQNGSDRDENGAVPVREPCVKQRHAVSTLSGNAERTMLMHSSNAASPARLPATKGKATKVVFRFVRQDPERGRHESSLTHVDLHDVGVRYLIVVLVSREDVVRSQLREVLYGFSPSPFRPKSPQSGAEGAAQ